MRSILIFALSCFVAVPTHAQQSQGACATVKIEIDQELSFERQAFDAKMKITNGLENKPLTQVSVNVWFKDQDGNPVSASTDPNASPLSNAFFYNVSSLDGVSAINGTAQIAPSSEAEIHWLIIPTESAAGGLLGGKLYFVGATLTYFLDGEPNEIELTPDFITVRPQPKLVLDYFLPQDVRADNPFTTQIIEAPEPFNLGVRVLNIGLASAYNTKIESSQPVITENLQNLLIGFQINGSFVDDYPATQSLLLNFGEVESNSARTGRWIMQTSLSGTFESFSATFSHADALGGQLTSLLESVNTHRLIRDVRVDLAGRDNVKDFLAKDNSVYNLYESEGLDTPVTNYTTLSLVPNGANQYYVDVPTTAGPLYVHLPDPSNGSHSSVIAASRIDGKIIDLANAWLSVEGPVNNTSRHFNLFDVNGGGRYFIELGTPALGPQAPVLQFIPDYTVPEGQPLTFVVLASNPNAGGNAPTLSVDLLPLGASFVDNGNGSGVFSWNTAIGQSGFYPVTFRASNDTAIGVLTSVQTPVFNVDNIGDLDQDGMLDLWELAYFSNKNRDGSGDFDGDGLSDLEEFLNGTDPTLAGNAPSVPEIKSPIPSAKITDTTPLLEIHNSTRGVEIESYTFEVYSDINFLNLVESQGNLPPGANNITTYQVSNTLADNKWYYWRARSSLAAASSEWVYGRFFVNTQNDAPTGLKKIWPLAGENTDILTSNKIQFEIFNAKDLDEDSLSYLFEVSATLNNQDVTLLSKTQIAGERGRTKFLVTVQPPPGFMPPYKWRVLANDGNGGTQDSGWSEFNFAANGTRPTAPFPLTPVGGLIPGNLPQGFVDLTARVATDLETPASLTYQFEISTNVNFDLSSPVAVTYPPYIGLYPDLAIARTGTLTPNTKYYWRVRAYDGIYYGPWVYSSFIYDNLQNNFPTTPVGENPGVGSRVDLSSPSLRVVKAEDVDGIITNYEFQLYESANLTQLVASHTNFVPYWNIEQTLINHKTYYWRARAQDQRGGYSSWSSLRPFLVSLDNSNTPPKIRIVNSNNGNFAASFLTGLKLEWEDSDPDSDAEIYFLLNGTPYSSGRKEDLDGIEDIFNTKPFISPPGTFQFTPVISDGLSFSTDPNCCTITVDNSILSGDLDSDGILDSVDNCIYFYNPDQADHGGILTTTPDGVGDACQCGDVNGDGVVSESDVDAIDAGLQKNVDPSFRHPEKCDLNGDQACTEIDLEYLSATLNVVIANGGISSGPLGGCESSIW